MRGLRAAAGATAHGLFREARVSGVDAGSPSLSAIPSLPMQQMSRVKELARLRTSALALQGLRLGPVGGRPRRTAGCRDLREVLSCGREAGSEQEEMRCSFVRHGVPSWAADAIKSRERVAGAQISFLGLRYACLGASSRSRAW